MGRRSGKSRARREAPHHAHQRRHPDHPNQDMDVASGRREWTSRVRRRIEQNHYSESSVSEVFAPRHRLDDLPNAARLPDSATACSAGRSISLDCGMSAAAVTALPRRSAAAVALVLASQEGGGRVLRCGAGFLAGRRWPVRPGRALSERRGRARARQRCGPSAGAVPACRARRSPGGPS